MVGPKPPCIPAIEAGVAFAFGFLLLVMAYAGPISGCHINPTVTIGLLLSGKFEAKHVPGYVIAQIAGAIIAGGVLLTIAGGTSAAYDPSTAGFAANGYGAHSPGGYNVTAAFVTEVTFFLVFTVLGATDIRAPVGFAGIPIGIVLVLIHLVGIPVTNSSVNPARSIGPAVFVGGWAISQLWLFIVTPLIGAAIASLLYKIVAASEP
jgi:aquaporin Z